MDFYHISMKEIESGPDKGQFVLFPDFVVGRTKDLMVRGKSFYAIWDDATGLWSTDEYHVVELVDADLDRYASDLEKKTGTSYKVKHLRSFSNGVWSQFRKYMQNISDNAHDLDTELTFANTDVKKNDYASRRLPYPLESGPHDAWDEIVGTLYSTEERAKIEWVIGSIVAGDAKKIHKFAVFYGPPGTGKSTILDIVERMFPGYSTTFDAKALGSSSAAFATEVFKNNPLVAIQHDGDLSRVEDNARLNSIVSHENMPMNEKYKPGYTSKVNAFLMLGTNKPVKISDAKSGLIRRLLDIHPTGVKIPTNHYHTLMAQVDFELGAIAQHCLDTYRSMGKNYYNGYRPLEMMLQTDIFFNFIEACYDIFKDQNGTTLKQAYSLYKDYCGDTGIDKIQPMYKVREELRNYFDEFHDKHVLDGVQVRSYYEGFSANKFKAPTKELNTFSLVLEETESLFDEEYADMPAQGYIVNSSGIEQPSMKWSEVKTTLADVNTSDLHYVKVPAEHIIIDFDLKDENGEKSLERNLEAASLWPPTYGELSKGGSGVHLHYNYNGDVTALAQAYSEGIEVKTLLGDASLRRRLSKCNNIPIASISSGLPLKEKKMLDEQTIKTERGLRGLVERNLRKEIHPGTKPSIDFIAHILKEAYENDMEFDLTDMRPKIMSFALKSSNQSLACLKIVQQMKFAGKSTADKPLDEAPQDTPGISFGGSAATQVAARATDERNAFYDVEVYPNLFVVCWKYEDSDQIVKMKNPKTSDIEGVLKLKLIGFNNRRYDNHILYGAFMGMTNEQLYHLSQKIINGDRNSMYAAAYGLSYADIYDFSILKQSLKKFMVELGLHHIEMDIPWDQPVPDDMVEKVVDYCCNDVLGTEATFKARKADFVARQILAELSGLTVNDTTAKHAARIIFGEDRNPQQKFKYTDLSKEFPGYTFDYGKSQYRDEDPSEGGYVYAEPGIYTNVAVMDVASMHPHSMIALNIFGDEYTPKFKSLIDARMAIKNKDFGSARSMFNGRLEPYLKDESDAKGLSDALKIVINSVYGLTSAKFDNPFRDRRNMDNIVAKRGALFMIDLKHMVQEQGFTVAHIKTDSIKIPNATPEILEMVERFGEKYGYTFEHETTYDKFALVNDAVYIARKPSGKWEAVGAQFQHPYVFKKLFSGEEIIGEDYVEVKQVQKGAIHLDFDAVQKPMHGYKGSQFIGKIGTFIPVTPESGGGIMYRIEDKDGETKRYAITGTKGYTWLEAEMANASDETIEIDMSYFENLADKAIETINKFGSFEDFLS